MVENDPIAERSNKPLVQKSVNVNYLVLVLTARKALLTNISRPENTAVFLYHS